MRFICKILIYTLKAYIILAILGEFMRLLHFIETTVFTKQITNLLIDDSYSDFQSFLSENPEVGDLIPGTGGVRKARWVLPNTGKGKRGGIRVLYYYLDEFGIFYMLSVYAKSNTINISDKDKNRLKQVILAIKKAHNG